MSAENHVYLDKEGDVIDLSIIYGVYKTRAGLTGFFRRQTNYNPVEVNDAVCYIMDHVHPTSCNPSDTRWAIKQIEGRVPIEHRPEYNMFVLVAFVTSIFYFAYLLYRTLVMQGASIALGSIDPTNVPFLDSLSDALSSTVNLLAILSTINLILVAVATISNAIALFRRYPIFAMIAEILYILSIFTYSGDWIVLAILTITTLAGWEIMSNE